MIDKCRADFRSEDEYLKKGECLLWQTKNIQMIVFKYLKD